MIGVADQHQSIMYSAWIGGRFRVRGTLQSSFVALQFTSDDKHGNRPVLSIKKSINMYYRPVWFTNFVSEYISIISTFKARWTIDRSKSPVMLLTKKISVRSLVSQIILGYACTSYNIIVSAYDFVIIGGGTSGLVVANRLSEIPNITIAVIEAGFSVLNNTNVSSVDGFTLGLNTAIDWQYATSSQTYAGGRILGYNAGKALGGTSTINGK